MQLSSGGHRRPLFPTLIATLAAFVPLVAYAQTDSSTGTDGVGVARLSFIDGPVSVQRGDSNESLAAVLNAPVLGGDYLTTGDAARAELQIDGYEQLRLGGDAQVRLTHLDTGNRAMQLAAGTVELRLLNRNDGINEIDTPSIAIKPQQRGAYRVTVTSDGQTTVTVRSGQAEIDISNQTQLLGPGSTFVAHGSANDPAIQTVAEIGRDDFDRFNTDRDRSHERALADSGFVNTDIGGIDDLDSNGRWVTDGSYGHVWVPASVGPDWAPYRDGRWVWEDGYGWTWLAAEPWGWAPYHYGSWYHSADYGWCWYPPQPRIYAPWRPALVAFIGFGAGSGSFGFGNDFTFGNIGWVPLAPFEPYHPWWGNRYGGRTTIVNNVTNITNVTNVTNVNVYRNVQYNAVSSVTSQRFTQGDFSRPRAVSMAQLQGARAFRSALPIVPSTANLRFTTRASAPQAAAGSTFVARSFAGRAGVVGRTAFTAQRSAYVNATHAAAIPVAPAAHASFNRATSAQPLERPAQRPVVAAPAVTHPASGPAATSPWARFSGSRTTATPDKAYRPAAAEPALAPPAAGTSTRPSTVTDPWARFNTSRGRDNAPHPPLSDPGERTTTTGDVPYHVPGVNHPALSHRPATTQAQPAHVYSTDERVTTPIAAPAVRPPLGSRTVTTDEQSANSVYRTRTRAATPVVRATQRMPKTVVPSYEGVHEGGRRPNAARLPAPLEDAPRAAAQREAAHEATVREGSTVKTEPHSERPPRNEQRR